MIFLHKKKHEKHEVHFFRPKDGGLGFMICDIEKGFRDARILQDQDLESRF